MLGEDDYLPISVKVACSDGKVFKQSEYSMRVGPVLTDAEMEAKYRYAYSHACIHCLEETSLAASPWAQRPGTMCCCWW